MKNYFVAFDDCYTNPTYASLESAYFVASEYEGEENPCIRNCNWVSVAPNTSDELQRYAEIMGWEVKEENGKLVLVTNITK